MNKKTTVLTMKNGDQIALDGYEFGGIKLGDIYFEKNDLDGDQFDLGEVVSILVFERDHFARLQTDSSGRTIEVRRAD